MWLQKVGSALGAGLKKAGGWLKSVASESDGSGSSSRIVVLMMSATVCGLLVAFFVIHKFLPEQGTLFGLAALVTAAAGGYAANKLSKDN